MAKWCEKNKGTPDREISDTCVCVGGSQTKYSWNMVPNSSVSWNDFWLTVWIKIYANLMSISLKTHTHRHSSLSFARFECMFFQSFSQYFGLLIVRQNLKKLHNLTFWSYVNIYSGFTQLILRGNVNEVKCFYESRWKNGTFFEISIHTHKHRNAM